VSGIYSIFNTVSRKQYVGSAVSIKHRWTRHLYLLRLGTHNNKKLQNSWNKHGASAFVFSILEDNVATELLLLREQYWINLNNCVENGYNVNPIAGSSRGTKRGPRSEETKAKISAAQKGKKLSEEHKTALKVAHVGMTGKTQSDAFKARMSEVHSDKVVSQETRAKMSASLKGRTSYVRNQGLYFAVQPEFMKDNTND
jgi:group I intron endonuclease